MIEKLGSQHHQTAVLSELKSLGSVPAETKVSRLMSRRSELHFLTAIALVDVKLNVLGIDGNPLCDIEDEPDEVAVLAVAIIHLNRAGRRVHRDPGSEYRLLSGFNWERDLLGRGCGRRLRGRESATDADAINVNAQVSAGFDSLRDVGLAAEGHSDRVCATAATETIVQYQREHGVSTAEQTHFSCGSPRGFQIRMSGLAVALTCRGWLSQ